MGMIKAIVVILVLLLTSSCATSRRMQVVSAKEVEKEKKKNYKRAENKFMFKTKQERIMECLLFVKKMGSDDKFAGEFCRGIYEQK